MRRFSMQLKAAATGALTAAFSVTILTACSTLSIGDVDPSPAAVGLEPWAPIAMPGDGGRAGARTAGTLRRSGTSDGTGVAGGVGVPVGTGVAVGTALEPATPDGSTTKPERAAVDPQAAAGRDSDGARLSAMPRVGSEASGTATASGGDRSESATKRAAAGSGFLGKISWYGHEWEGRTTASGEPFDADALTMAHRSLPFGTRVRVTNPTNGRSVLVRVNDRGPYIFDRVADLSRAAAERLGIIEDGVIEAIVQVVPSGRGARTASGQAERSGGRAASAANGASDGQIRNVAG